MKQISKRSFQHGFSLIEVMVAVLVLAVGILAVSKLQSSLLRSGSSANHRTVAATIVHRKIDDLSRFIYVNSSSPAITWDNIITIDTLKGPSSLAFEHIEDNKGGRIPSGTLALGNINYTLSWSVVDYYYSGINSPATTTAITTYPDFKLAHVIASWDGVGDDTNNVVSFDTAIYSYAPSLTATSDTGGTGNNGPTDEKDTNAPDNTEIQDDQDANKAQVGSEVAPNISAKGASNVVDFESLVYNTSSGKIQRRDTFKTVGCACKNGTNSSLHLTALTTWDTADETLKDIVELSTYSISNTAVALNGSTGDNDQSFYCGICCRDGIDGHPDNYKTCRLKNVSGGYKLYPNWKLIGYNIVPEDFINKSTNEAIYSTYVTSLVRHVASIERNSGAEYFLNSYATVDNTFVNYASTLITGGDYDDIVNNSSFQLQARAVYMDEIPDGIFYGTTASTATIPLDRIPFYDVDLTQVAGWAPDEDDLTFTATYTGNQVVSNKWEKGLHDEIPSGNPKTPCQSFSPTCVSNQRLIDATEGSYTRGVFYSSTTDGGTTVQSQIFTGSDGWVDRDVNNEPLNTTSIIINVTP